MSSNVFMNNQLERIADYIDAGKAGGGSLTVNLSGVGDMTGATAGQAGAHGLVPAPAAGDQDKVLTGAGAWVDQSSGGVNYSTSEQDTGLKWIDGSTPVYQQTLEFNGISQQLNDWVSLGPAPTGLTRLLKYEVSCNTAAGWQVSQMYVSFKVQNGILYYYSILGYGTMDMIVTLYYLK